MLFTTSFCIRRKLAPKNLSSLAILVTWLLFSWKHNNHWHYRHRAILVISSSEVEQSRSKWPKLSCQIKQQFLEFDEWIQAVQRSFCHRCLFVQDQFLVSMKAQNPLNLASFCVPNLSVSLQFMPLHFFAIPLRVRILVNIRDKVKINKID